MIVNVDNIDILLIDSKIRDNFQKEFNRLEEYKKKKEQIQNLLDNKNIKQSLSNRLQTDKNKLTDKINCLKDQQKLNLYIMDTLPYIEKYKKIISTPIKFSFLGKLKKSENTKEKEKIIEEYIKIAQKYIFINFNYNNKKNIIKCKNCSKKKFEIEDNIYICKNCYTQQIVMKYNSSYNDIHRINITKKYVYDRKIHFRDCINQYQGKQNCTISPKVYKDLEKEFERHHLLVGDINTPKKIRFKNITKNHISIFLKELGYSKHYENIQLIHHNLTDIKSNDISHLKEKLLDDFDVLSDLYDKLYNGIDRKNFINTQYVLYQLLRRHKYKCKKEDFVILKTVDRKFFHDEVCKTLFQELGWNHSPFY